MDKKEIKCFYKPIPFAPEHIIFHTELLIDSICNHCEYSWGFTDGDKDIVVYNRDLIKEVKRIK